MAEPRVFPGAAFGRARSREGLPSAAAACRFFKRNVKSGPAGRRFAGSLPASRLLPASAPPFPSFFPPPRGVPSLLLSSFPLAPPGFPASRGVSQLSRRPSARSPLCVPPPRFRAGPPFSPLFFIFPFRKTFFLRRLCRSGVGAYVLRKRGALFLPGQTARSRNASGALPAARRAAPAGAPSGRRSHGGTHQ